MKRTTGITASAVIAFIGSAGAILMGALIVLAAIIARSSLEQNPTSGISPEASVMNLAGIAVMYVGFGVWGIVSGIGILRLRNWARICFAVFGGILAVFSLLVIVGMLMAFQMGPQFQQAGTGPSPQMFEAILSLFIVLALLCTALGIWWLIYFNRQSVRVLFPGEERTVAPSRFPLSISIISWILIVGGIVLLPRVLAPSPLLVFSFLVQGFALRVIYLLFAAVSIASGIGMLKKVEAAYSLALIYCAYCLVNALAAILIPGSSGRREQFIREIQGTSPMILPLNTIVTLSILFGLAIACAGLWFLLTRRNTFLEVAKE